MEQTQSMSPKIFLNKVLAGTATGIIIGLIPNAVLGAILRYFSGSSFAMAVAQMAVIFQLATPLIIGGLIALQFGFAPMKMMVVAGAAFVGSGVVKFTPELGETVCWCWYRRYHQYDDHCFYRSWVDLSDW